MKQWLPDKHTIGDFVGVVLKIDTEADAADFWKWCVDWIQRQIDAGKWQGRDNAVTSARANIGWCFGEGMKSDRVAMWQKVCQASHPIFGDAVPTPETALELGKKYAEAAK